MALTFSPIIPARRKVHSEGFSYFNLNERDFEGSADPVLNVDHFRMSERPFPARPLAGFVAVTAVLENSSGGFVGRDHLGLHAQIDPGGLYGLVAGSGMIAEESPNAGKICEGIHVSLNLSSKLKRQPPRSFTLEPKQVKEWKPNPQIRGRVFLGKLAGAESSVSLPAPISFFEFFSKPKMSVSPRVLAESGGIVYVMSGKIRVSSGDKVISVEAMNAIGFANEEKDVELFIEALDESHFIFITGRSCREPIVTHGGFVMNTQAEIADAIKRYQSGEMGKLV
jgi:redox-sensitive bicupin YhaK (pirin superfamily)